MATANRSKVAAARSQYTSAKREYHSLGKKAFGKPKSSKIYKEYKTAKSRYRAAGRTLGKITKLKPRRR